MASHTAAVHGLSELLCGLAGLIEASRLMSGQPAAGRGAGMPDPYAVTRAPVRGK